MLFIFKYLYIYHLILISKATICILLNVSVKNHEKTFCHEKFGGTCSSVKILKGNILMG